MCFAYLLKVLNVCVKFHEYMPSGFTVIVRTKKMLTHGNNSKSRKTRVLVHVLCMSSYGVKRLCEVS